MEPMRDISHIKGFMDIEHKGPTDYEIHNLAKFMHEVYERISQEVGWKTQEECQTSFEKLPEKNRIVMETVAEEVLTKLVDGNNALELSVDHHGVYWTLLTIYNNYSIEFLKFLDSLKQSPHSSEVNGEKIVSLEDGEDEN